MEIDTALILCAGLGTRMEDLTAKTPKPLLSVWGKTLLDHTLTKLLKAGIQNIIINTHYLPEKIEAHLIPWRTHLRDFIIFHEPELKGTGGSVAHATRFTNGKPFFVLNGDLLWQEKGDSPLIHMDVLWQQKKQPILALVKTERAFGYDGPGDFFTNNGCIVHKKSRHQKAPYVFAGLQIFDPLYASQDVIESLRLSPPFSVHALWSAAIAEQNMGAFFFPDRWYHVGTKSAFQRLCYA